ncbi:MAG: hypothetical protein PHS93_00965 [Candidatus Omnitrophica bacterium]|nr:hypothetical protein [Candidatus Omnitrophota bacterium]MDD5351724.1 hypothetical protein [Candidatus Omnitrophota bacterium]MDD5550934.1 hypothetical protein [Candidatus Omnitrophota bacterium]
MQFKTIEGEAIVKEGKANKTNFFISQGGDLYLTNKRLVFIGHGVNIATSTLAVSLSEVLIIRKAFTWTILALLLPIPNAFKITLNNGKVYKFTVFKREDWISVIENAVSR